MKKFYSQLLDGDRNVVLSNGKVSKYFKYSEFKGGNPKDDRIAVDPAQVLLLEQVREKFGVVIIQCANRPLPAVSYHNPDYGDSCATDFDVGNGGLGTVDYLKVVQFLERLGARHIGLYDYIDLNKNRVKFIHMDMGSSAKKFWTCNKMDSTGKQVLVTVKTFMPKVVIDYTTPKRTLKWIRTISLFRMKGSDVKWLQTALNILFAERVLSVDGDFGAKTDAMVKRAKGVLKLPEATYNGIADANFIARIKEELNIL